MNNDYKSIEFYISKIDKKKEIVSNPRFIYFDEDKVVLLVYPLDRIKVDEFEDVMKKLKDIGINVPICLETKLENSLYFVLLEKPAGNLYRLIGLEKKFEELASIPIEHCIKLIQDIKKMDKLSVELIISDFFYDKEVGFTLLDISGYFDKEYDDDNVFHVCSKFYNIILGLFFSIPKLNNESNDIEKTKPLIGKFTLNVFKAFEKSMPEYNKYKRWIIRSYFINGLDMLIDANYDFGNLELTDEEKIFFDSLVEDAADKTLNKILNCTDVSSIDKKYDINYNSLLLQSSLPYYKDYKYQNIMEHYNHVYLEKARKLYLENLDNNIIKNELIEAMMKFIEVNNNDLFAHIENNFDKFLNMNVEQLKSYDII